MGITRNPAWVNIYALETMFVCIVKKLKDTYIVHSQGKVFLFKMFFLYLFFLGYNHFIMNNNYLHFKTRICFSMNTINTYIHAIGFLNVKTSDPAYYMIYT